MTAAGGCHSVVLRDDGRAIACGANEYGQCDVPATLPWIRYVAVAAGKSHTALLQSDGQAAAHGLNERGQCSIPVLPPGLRYVGVACGADHTVLLRSDRRVAACGDNAEGQCCVPTGAQFIAVSAGHWHTVLLASDGHVTACGLNNFGQCNIPSLPSDTSYVAMSAGTFHTVLLRSDGQAIACGLNNHGQFNIPPLPAGVSYTAVAAGAFHTLLLRSDGEVIACGQNDEGQCDLPLLPSDGDIRYIAVAAGGLHTVLLRSDGQVATAGPNVAGQCGIPTPSKNHRYVMAEDISFDAAPPDIMKQAAIPPGIFVGADPAAPPPLPQLGVAALPDVISEQVVTQSAGVIVPHSHRSDTGSIGDPIGWCNSNADSIVAASVTADVKEIARESDLEESAISEELEEELEAGSASSGQELSPATLSYKGRNGRDGLVLQAVKPAIDRADQRTAEDEESVPEELEDDALEVRHQELVVSEPGTPMQQHSVQQSLSNASRLQPPPPRVAEPVSDVESDLAPFSPSCPLGGQHQDVEGPCSEPEEEAWPETTAQIVASPLPTNRLAHGASESPCITPGPHVEPLSSGKSSSRTTASTPG